MKKKSSKSCPEYKSIYKAEGLASPTAKPKRNTRVGRNPEQLPTLADINRTKKKGRKVKYYHI